MIRKVVCLAVVATLAVGVAFVSGRLLARADDAAPGDRPTEEFTWGLPVAVIDVASVFKNCESFNEGMTELKQKYAQKEQEFRVETDAINDLADRLKSIDIHSEEDRQWEEEFASRQSSLYVRMERTRKEFMILEAELYAATYKELQSAVQTYAKAHGIRLVVRYSDNPMDPNEPASVTNGVNRNIVFQNGIDITEEITRWLNDKNVS